MNVSDYWSNYEVTARNYEDLQRHISSISHMAVKKNRTIVWRGQVDANWPLTSRLYRTFINSNPYRITEKEFSKLEQRILVELRKWGLHSQRIGGRLSILSQLAMLQHYGTPTRLIDITFNALVAAFFATEYSKNEESKNGRIFAIDITDRIINENKYLRDWEDSLDTPWSKSFKKSQHGSFENPIELDEYLKNWDYEWTTHYYAWKPPSLDGRIAAQNGGFIFGGVVGTILREGYIDFQNRVNNNSSFQVVNPSTGKWLPIDEFRELTCLAIKPKNIPTKDIRDNTRNAVYSIKISAESKKSIREDLEKIYGYNHSTIYPDFPGFSNYGVSKILDH